MFNLYTSRNPLISPRLNSDHVREQYQSSRSTQQMYRYKHETIPNSLLHFAIPPCIILLFCLVPIILIFSQILIVHTSPRGTYTSPMEKARNELKQMDESMEDIIQKTALPIDKWRHLFHIQTYVHHFQYLFDVFNGGNQSAIDSTKFDFSDNQKNRSYCNEEPSQLKGRILNENSTFPNVSLEEIETNYSDVRLGGHWSPSHCLARHKVAIIIPYRDRFEHLVTLLYYLHPILQRQELDYTIYVSEQIGNGTYNKGVLMNAAFIYASNEYDYQCFVFHDVDLIPEDDRNMYSCPTLPRHMSVAVNEMKYQLTYEELIGGVFSIRKEHFLTVNGYSDLYWGWGAEDDDLYYRLKHKSLKVIRPPSSIARYRMIAHTKRAPSVWKKRSKLLRSAAKRYPWDGLTSAHYDMISVTRYSLFTHMIMDVGVPPVGFN